MNKDASNAGTQTSGENMSYWIDSVRPLEFETLTKEITTEVLIVGAGIAGLSVAYSLLESGHEVTVVEDGLVGSGETGRTTAHLTNALDDRYFEIEKLFGEEKSRLAAESHSAAINRIESIVQKEQIDCDFTRLNGYLFLDPSDKVESLQKELEATRKAGLETELLDIVPGINLQQACLEFPRQAQFHIMKYIKGLANAIKQKGGKIYTRTKAVDIKEGSAAGNGFAIQADKIIVATNTPVNDFITMHTKQFAYRTYVIGSLIPKNSVTPALWWDTGNQDSKWIANPYHYVRLQKYNEEYDLVISGGEDHKTGQADKEDIPEDNRFAALESWTRDHFPGIQEIKYKWSGQVMEPVDAMAYIGKNPGNKNVYIVTGDSGNGMTHGTIAGLLISDLINNIKNPWEELYSPARIPTSSIGSYMKELASMAGQYGDWLTSGDVVSEDKLQPGEGAIVRSGLHKVAIYKDDNSVVHAYTATCPHLGCIVQWNAEEKSFDCPCHGSRFSKEGKVINGPASSDLEKIKSFDHT